MQKAVEIQHKGMILRGMEHVPDEGSSFPAVILFHGFTGNCLEPHRMFLKISRALEKRGIASFRFDFLGSGESDGDFENMTLSSEVAEAKTILDHVKLDSRIDSKKISLLGLSMGGLVASLVAGDRPEEIDRLVLMAPAGHWMKKIAEERQPKKRQMVYDHGGNLIGRGFLEDLQSIEVYPRAAHFDGKVLLIHGNEDKSVPTETTFQYKQLSYGVNADVRIIDGADHTFNRHEWEQEVIQLVKAFLLSEDS